MPYTLESARAIGAAQKLFESLRSIRVLFPCKSVFNRVAQAPNSLSLEIESPSDPDLLLLAGVLRTTRSINTLLLKIELADPDTIALVAAALKSSSSLSALKCEVPQTPAVFTPLISVIGCSKTLSDVVIRVEDEEVEDWGWKQVKNPLLLLIESLEPNRSLRAFAFDAPFVSPVPVSDGERLAAMIRTNGSISVNMPKMDDRKAIDEANLRNVVSCPLLLSGYCLKV